jgi:pimeloyl-ACP methyl ester carboxylesterase
MPPSTRKIVSDPAAHLAVAALTEAVLPGVEFGMLVTDPVFWGINVPRGDGHSVLLIPGLLGSDDSLQTLSDWLRRAGYRPIWSGLRIVSGFSEAAIERVTERAEREHRRTGSRVSIIGHSMGGVLGRSAALRRPNSVRHVITMGSPMFYEARYRLSLSVALTAIYSRSDRIVRHPHALARDTHAENIEVTGSHIGLAHNGEVYRHLARALVTAS